MFVPNESLDLLCTCHSVGGLRIPIIRALVSLIKVVTQILAGVHALLDQLSSVLVQLSSLSEQRPTVRISVLVVINEQSGAHGR